MKSILLFTLLLSSLTAQAGFLRKGIIYSIRHVQLVPANNGQFHLKVDAYDSQFLLINDQGEPVSYGYTDAKNFSKDLQQSQMMIACKGGTPAVHNRLQSCHITQLQE